MRLHAGVAQVCVSPPIGVELSGYGPFLHRRSRAVHDDLYAAALVLDDGATRVAIVTSDIISYDASVVEHIRRLASRETGIPADHILVSCIHSHTAPTAQPLRAWGECDSEYVSLLARQVAGAIQAASYARQPARLGCGRGDHPDLAWNRTRRGQAEVPVDTSVQVLRVDSDVTGQPLAILVNYACHPVMLGPIAAVSADYPGALRRHVSAALGGAVVLFANGACGDIDPVSNREVWGKATFEDVDRAGALLAREVVRVAEGIVPRDSAALAARSSGVGLPYQVLEAKQVEDELERRLAGMRPPAAGLEGADQVRRRWFWHRWASDVLAALSAGAAPTSASADLQAIRVGDAVVVAVPAELFTAMGLAVKARSAYDHTFIATCANGNVGYIPTREDFAEGAYASSMAFAIYGYFQWQPDVGDRLVEALAPLVI